MNKIYFNAREWFPAKECPENVASRTFMTGLEGNLVEVYALGNWNWNWSEIISKSMELEKDTDYVFTFWLNGGENDRNDEICDFRILYSDNETDFINRDTEYIYKLNRNYIKPVKKFAGWELYEIPFHTESKQYTRLKFVQLRAPAMIMPAKDVEHYKDFVDTEDEFSDKRPQRHNLVFEDGWPKNQWYSTQNLKNINNNSNNNNNSNKSNNSFSNHFNNTGESFKNFSSGMNPNTFSDEVRDELRGELEDELRDELEDEIREELRNEIEAELRNQFPI